MSNYPSASSGQEKILRLVAGMLLLSWLVLGNGGLGEASETQSLLQIQRDRITGVLTQVPLGKVLEQLQEKLAIEYVVPGEELDKPVSANLTGESVIKTLSKILVSWDYAFQVDQQGKVNKIFVVDKMRPIEIEENAVKISEPKMAAFPENENMTRSEPILRMPKSQILLPGTKMTSNPERDAMPSPMFIEPLEELRPMGIQPSQDGPMGIQPSSNFMPVIPASGYPPMDILPVSEDAQREFLEGHN